MPAKPRKRRQRAHDVLPAGFVWRDGRPRWVPSPTRRRQGWRALDLKDAWGRWLKRGDAVAKAEALAAAVKAWAAGEPVPAPFVHLAPAGADVAGASAAQLSPRAIGALLDAYLASDRFTRELSATTQVDYRRKLDRFLGVVAVGRRADVDKAAAARALAKLRALDIDLFLPPAFGEQGVDELQETYDWMRHHVGVNMAHGCMAAVSAWFGWCVKKRRLWPTNPAELVERVTPDGRIRVASLSELRALVAAAQDMGLPSVADAVVLAVDLSWSQQDLLALEWGQVAADGHVRHRRIKTGVAGNPPLLAVGRACLARIRARLGAANVLPSPGLRVLLNDTTGGAYPDDGGEQFRRRFDRVRARAAQTCSSVADLQFRDLRDTAITFGIDAGLSVEEVCSRSLHAPARAQAVITKHYGAIRQGVADRAAQRLDAHFEAMGYTFGDEFMALPGA